jgi:hypothetical protein
MYGKIIFGSVEELAKFLKEFTGSTAIFKVMPYSDNGEYQLEFTGGY